MADINQVQLPDGSQYNIKDTNSGYATTGYVQDQISAIDKSTIGLGNVDNTSDQNKPVSIAQQNALDEKTNTSMVAHVQTSLTADMRYLVGGEFIYQGNLYKATAIIPNGDAIVINTNAVLADDISTQIGNANTAIGTLNTTVAGKANKSDLTNLDLTGTTNNTGSTIGAGTYFYLNGTLVRAKTAIANGATFTLNTNYEVVSAGALNSRGMKKLWENPNPTANFAAQNISLSSSDYDFLLVLSIQDTSHARSIASTISKKGQDIAVNTSYPRGSNTYITVLNRIFTYVDDTSYSVADCISQNTGSASSTSNSSLIPIAIYGIKI